MNRTEKAAEIDSLKAHFSNAKVAVLADYKGLTVSQLTGLRQKLRENQASFKVVKNRLAKIAIKDTPYDELRESFTGTTAIAVSTENPTGPVKALVEFAKDNELLSIKACLLDGKVIGLKDIDYLASLPSKEELIAKLMASMQAPASNFVNVLSQIPRQIVNVLSAVRDQKGKE